jgi:hypothetical protein
VLPQIKVIKEHGPPTFDVAESSPHNSSPNALNHSGSGKSANTDAAAAADLDPLLHAASNGSGHSFNSATTNGIAAAAAAAATIAAAAADDASPTSSTDAAAAADIPNPADPFSCGVQGSCSAEIEQRSVRCIRQMSSDEIIMHWRQFLQDVSEELLTADDAQEQQRLQAGDLLGLEGMGCCAAKAAIDPGPLQKQEEEPSDDSTFTMSRECRWCGCTNVDDALHLAGGCSMGEEGKQQSGDAAGAGPAAAAAAAAACSAGGPEQRIQELVSKYSYMTKFVALLNPGRHNLLLCALMDRIRV